MTDTVGTRSVDSDADGSGALELASSGEMTALAQISAAEVNVMIATAKRFPRSISLFQKRILDLVTLDEETAASMFFSLPRGKKNIEGRSVRFAEMAAHAWGNIHYAARLAHIDDRYVHAEGSAWDLEANVKGQGWAVRRITDRYGRRYDDDMIGMTAQAAIAIAKRNAILTAIPLALTKHAYDEARLTAIGKAKTMEQRRAKAVEMFGKMDVGLDRILAALERKGIEDLTTEDLMELRGLFTAIKDGQVSIEEAFPTAPKPDAAPKTLGDLAKKATDAKPEPDAAAEKPAAEGAGLFAKDWKNAATKAKK